MFHAANRIVVETPAYGNATFFFEIEQPMPVAQQVRIVHSGRRALPSRQVQRLCAWRTGGVMWGRMRRTERYSRCRTPRPELAAP